MRRMATCMAVAGVGLAVLILAGFGGSSGIGSTSNGSSTENVDHYMTLLKSGSAQQKAQAAYWLGRQRVADSRAVDSLADLLGDKTEIDASRYRQTSREHKPTLGEEAAAALVQIGRPAIAPLIRVLKTSPSAEARKNAAWALGALHENTASTDSQAA